jgi:hypothetical protein
MTFKEWSSTCRNTECGFKGRILGWDYDLPLDCPKCGEPTELLHEIFNTAHGIATDDIPGGLAVRHGVCHDDGSPRMFYSKTDLKRALNEKGLCIVGDTPGRPYKVTWSGKVDTNYTGRREE